MKHDTHGSSGPDVVNTPTLSGAKGEQCRLMISYGSPDGLDGGFQCSGWWCRRPEQCFQRPKTCPGRVILCHAMDFGWKCRAEHEIFIERSLRT